jgi:fibronectin type 3 domain-containing protein
MNRKHRASRLFHRCIENLEQRRLLTTYYVDNAPADHGSDSNAGNSLSAPFLTIQKAASIAQPGDTVDILAGTYRETVTTANSGTASAPITYQPYNNEQVTISGADIVNGGWTQYSGNIYQTSNMTWTMGGQDDQLFVDGQMINFARWPNTSLDVSHPNVEYTGPNTKGVQNSNGTLTETIYDANLTQPAGYWNGATIHIQTGAIWVYEAATITNYTRAVVNGVSYGVITYTSSFTSTTYNLAGPGDPYYITGDPYFTAGSFQTLNGPGDFYRDPNTGKLYLWTPNGDSPANHLIEAKHREWAFDLSGDSYININGINIFAASIKTTSTSNHIVINGINAQYVSHFENYTGGWIPYESNGSAVVGSTGIVLDGSYDTLENSTIAYSAGDGVFLGGNNEVVYNNTIHDVDYLGMTCAGIDEIQFEGPTTSGDVIDYNTIYNSGRADISVSGLSASLVSNNVAYSPMLQTADGAAIYGYDGNGNGTEIDRNIVFNSYGSFNGFPICGIFLDQDSTGYTIDHNLVYNVGHGIKLFDALSNNILNNTIVNTAVSLDLYGAPTGTIANNILTSAISETIWSSQTITNSITSSTNPAFVSPSTNNYQLQSSSPAINKGIVVAPYTNGYIGSAPDIGAFEYGASAWTAGAGSAAAALAATALPAGWTAADIGAPAIPGSSYYSGGVFTVEGAGNDIWNASDQFQFVDTPETGNETIIARVGGQSNSSGWAKAGVMFRASSAASSAFVAVVETPSNGVNLLSRDPSGNLKIIQSAAVGAPVWLKLVRAGNVFTAYDSVDGVNWTSVGSDTITLPTTSLVGLAVTSENTAMPSTANFDNVSLLPLASPTGVTATYVTSTSVQLNWTASLTANSYQIQRSSDGTNYSTIASVGNVTSYLDSGASGNTEYYRIVALNGAGSSSPSATATAARQAPVLPTSPTGVTATGITGGIALSWSAGANDTTYNVYRSTSAGSEGSTPYATGITTTSFTDTQVTVGQTYYYTVAGVNGNGTSAASAEVSASALAAAVADGSFESTSVKGSYAYDPTTANWKFTGNAGIEANGSAWNAANAPDGTQAAFLQSLNASSGGSISQSINFLASGKYQFTFYASQRASYGIEPFTVSVDGSVIGTFTPGSTAFQSYSTTPVSLASGTHVLSFATASTSSSDSASFIDKVSVTTVALSTNPPAGVSATAGVGAITLSWTAPAGAVSYNIYRGTSAGGEGTTPLVTGITSTSYVDTTATAGTTYYYVVTAVNGSAGASQPSSEVSATVTTVKITGTPIGTATSYSNNGDTIAQVIDGNFNTFYDAPDGSLTQWVGLDMGAARTITQIQYAPRAGYEWRMVGAQFQVSNTADFSAGVVTLFTITTAPIAGQFTAVQVNPGAAYRYVRYIGGTGWVNISEMEVDGLPASTPVYTKLTGTPIGTQTSYLNNGDTIAQVFDGNFNTYFDAPNSSLTNWVGLDLGSPQQIAVIKYAPRAGYEWRMVGGQFQVSSTPDFSSNVQTLYTITTAPVAGQFTTINVSPNAAYRYVRYVGGTSWVNIAEMEVDGIYTAPPVSSTQLTGTVIGTPTSWLNNGDTIAQVFDGNLNTYYDAADNNLSDWAGLDLGTARTITQISYAPRAGYEYRMVGGQFQVSNTANFSSGVVTLFTITSAPTAGQLTTVSVSAPGTYRYIRYVGGTQWVNIAEMQVFGY